MFQQFSCVNIKKLLWAFIDLSYIMLQKLRIIILKYKWINFTPIIIQSYSHKFYMLTCFLRIGPLVVLQVCLVGAAIVLYAQSSPSCYYYTCFELAVTVYLIQMIAALWLIKSNTNMRKKYVSEVATEPNLIFYLRLIWNNLNIILVLTLLCSIQISDGINLSGLQKQHQGETGENQNLKCQFALYSLCLFTQIEHKIDFDQSETMIMWLLYTCTLFINGMLSVFFSREYYQYCSILRHNRKLGALFKGCLTEALLDCKLYNLKETVIKSQIEQQILQCSICLHRLDEKIREDSQGIERIIKLRCGHFFHHQCLDKWLKVRDYCPFRCSPVI